MAIWFQDYVNGNDSNAGTSWGAAFKTIQGATSGKGVVAGDTIQIAKSPDPTSLGQTATWTTANQTLLGATKALSAATNATPIACTTTASHGWSTGDYVMITGALGNTAANGVYPIIVTGSNTFTLTGSAGNGVWTSAGTVTWWTNHAVVLTTAVTATVDNCDVAWTAANSATVSATSAAVKEGRLQASIQPPSSAANTLYAFHALGSTIDFSAYQQLSFWIRNGVAISNATTWRICLCSDTAGVTIVNSAAIPAIPSINQSVPVTVDFGVALGSSIQSVALYSGASTMATVQLLIDNIIACKASSSADSLTLQSLISKNTGTEGWFCIQSINGTTVLLDCATSTANTTGRGYSGSTGTVTTYKRETIKTAMAPTSPTNVQTAALTGILGTTTTYSGGYNTSNSVQDGQTYFDGQNGFGTGLGVVSNNFSLSFDHLNFCHYNLGISPNSATSVSFSGNDCSNNTTGISFVAPENAISVTYANVNHNATNGIAVVGFNTQIAVTNCNSNVSNNFTVNNSAGLYGTLTNCCNSGSSGMTVASSCGNVILRGATINNNGTLGISFGAPRCLFKDYVFSKNATADISASPFGVYAESALYNCSFSTLTTTSSLDNTRIGSHNHNQVAGSHKIFAGSWTAITDTVNVNVSPTAWKVNLTTTNNSVQLAAARVALGRLAVNASTLVTVTAYLRRDSTNVNMGIACPGGQIAGIDTDQLATITPSINTYAQATLTFTPSEAGVVDIEFWVWSATANVNAWVTDLTFAQV